MDRRRALPLVAGTHAAATPTTSSAATHCTPFVLPSDGILQIDTNTTITLAADTLFQPVCTGTVDLSGNTISSTITDLRDPFFASTIPQCYALAATTVIAYALVIMLLITPRTFLQGGGIILGKRGFTNGPSSGEAGIGIGGRPWLQKVATLTVAVSLTIATADTFKVAQAQYEIGYMDAKSLQAQVLDGLELKIMRIISDTFLWLAQAQTLIRLFPRQREKVIIKWTAFALILLDLIFGILDSFVVSTQYTRPKSFNEAIPALSYLFQLALGVLYCAWVIYYSITKKRYAFYHPQMRNICLVALLSIVALFVPIVFFMTDIINHDVAAWGDYVRWVGAAAASVVVWEWVERIEALERNEKKDGVLGREVFDGDEMLDATPSSDAGHSRQWSSGRSGSGKATGTARLQPWPAMSSLATRYRAKLPGKMLRTARRGADPGTQSDATKSKALQLPRWPARPVRIATPVNRAETASAESTVYAVRYHPVSVSVAGQRMPNGSLLATETPDLEAQREAPRGVDDNVVTEKDENIVSNTPELRLPNHGLRGPRLQTVLELANPFSRRARSPPAEISAHAKQIRALDARNTQSGTPRAPDTGNSTHNTNTSTNSSSRLIKPGVSSRVSSSNITSKWDIFSKLEDFASIQAERRVAARSRNNAHDVPALPVTRIPAPPRARTASQMAALLEGAEAEMRGGVPHAVAEAGVSHTSVAPPTEFVAQDAYTPTWQVPSLPTAQAPLTHHVGPGVTMPSYMRSPHVHSPESRSPTENRPPQRASTNGLLPSMHQDRRPPANQLSQDHGDGVHAELSREAHAAAESVADSTTVEVDLAANTSRAVPAVAAGGLRVIRIPPPPRPRRLEHDEEE